MFLTYPVVVETDGKGHYSAFFPDLPGCITAGDSLEECFEMAHEALALHLSGMEEDNEPFPLPTPLQKVSVDEPEEEDPEEEGGASEIAAVLLVSVTRPGKKVRINASLDAALLAAIDTVTSNRSAFLEDAAWSALRKRQAG